MTSLSSEKLEFLKYFVHIDIQNTAQNISIGVTLHAESEIGAPVLLSRI
jgi:hypothetical protein